MTSEANGDPVRAGEKGVQDGYGRIRPAVSCGVARSSLEAEMVDV